LRVGQANILNHFACEIGMLAVDARVKDRDCYISTGYGESAVPLTKVVIWTNSLYSGCIEVRIGVER
jgi:hypothetical protein